MEGYIDGLEKKSFTHGIPYDSMVKLTYCQNQENRITPPQKTCFPFEKHVISAVM